MRLHCRVWRILRRMFSMRIRVVVPVLLLINFLIIFLLAAFWFSPRLDSVAAGQENIRLQEQIIAIHAGHIARYYYNLYELEALLAGNNGQRLLAYEEFVHALASVEGSARQNNLTTTSFHASEPVSFDVEIGGHIHVLELRASASFTGSAGDVMQMMYDLERGYVNILAIVLDLDGDSDSAWLSVEFSLFGSGFYEPAY